jgi:type IX secretion system PorP/SprF family membrane protein
MKPFMKIVLTGIVLLLGSTSLFAQQQATYAQYMFNGLAINPAYAGQHEALSLNVLARFNNVGLKGAPNTQTFAAHSPLVNQRMAVGALIVNDKIGVIKQTGVNGIYAYRLPMGKGNVLSMGMQVGFSSYRAAYTNLETYQPDPVFAQDVRQTRPNIGAGAFYNAKVWYVGLSMPHMVNNVFTRGTDFNTVRQSVPAILSGGFVTDLSHKVKFKPNILFKWVDNRPAELDLNANFLIEEVVWLGASYRSSNGLNFLLDMQVTDQLRFGYSYSLALGQIRTVEIGSHEFFLGYIFKFNMKGIVTPRYF